LEQSMTFVGGQMEEIRQKLVLLLVKTLQETGQLDCSCEQALMIMQPPKNR